MVRAGREYGEFLSTGDSVARTSQVRVVAVWAFIVLSFTSSLFAQDLGNLSANPFGSNSTANPFSPAGNPFSPTSPNNAFGVYGNPFSDQSVTNPYATNAPSSTTSKATIAGSSALIRMIATPPATPMAAMAIPIRLNHSTTRMGPGTRFYPRVLIIRMAVDGGLKVSKCVSVMQKI
jgi:hypothetical protein